MLQDLDLTFCASGLVAVFLAIQWYQNRGPNLDAIPTVGYSNSLLSYITAVRYLFDGRKLTQEGYDKYKGGVFKIAMLDHWEVIASGPRAIEDISRAPTDTLSLLDAAQRTAEVDYTLGPEIRRDPYHVPIIRSRLTRGLNALFPAVREEIIAAFDELVPVTDEWVSYPAQETLMQIVSRASNRVFVGLPKCRDADFCALNVEFTIAVVKAVLVLNRFPDMMKSLASRLLTSIPSARARAIRHLAPIIEERRAKQLALGDSWDDKPNDMLMWLMDEAQGQEQSVRNLAIRILTVNFTAIHTSSMSFTQALYHLAANPEYACVLRKEVESVVAEEGWTKHAVGKMLKLDSFIRESQRLNGLGLLTLQRYALKPFTLSSGQTIPAGTFLSCTSLPTHHDPELYADPDMFDPWRFASMRESHSKSDDDLSALARAKLQMVSTSTDFLAFGHGKHACPGRFFAAHELKAMLAHVIVAYDVKFENGAADFPPNLFIGSACLPGKGQVMFRKRQVSDELTPASLEN